MGALTIRYLFLSCFACFFPQAVSPQAPMTYIYNAPESEMDLRYIYQWEILRTALEATVPAYGAYIMTPGKVMSELRQAQELMSSSGQLTVVYLDVKPGFSEKLHVVPIPVERNLMGYRVLLIRKEMQEKLAGVRTAEDLKEYTFGLGLGWIDVDIMKANGFKVTTGSTYEGLFQMLALERFDVFSRSVTEVGGEMSVRGRLLPRIAIENTLCLSLPMPMFFWFSKTPEGARLAARVEAGMRKMMADGTYERIFQSHFRERLADLNLPARRVLQLKNPFIPPGSVFDDRSFWYSLE